jgi:hypothetical protein
LNQKYGFAGFVFARLRGHVILINNYGNHAPLFAEGSAHPNRAAALCGAAKKENGAPEWQLI